MPPSQLVHRSRQCADATAALHFAALANTFSETNVCVDSLSMRESTWEFFKVPSKMRLSHPMLSLPNCK